MMKLDATSMYRKLRLVAAAGILSITSGCAALSDRLVCRTLIDPPYETDPAAAQLHQTLTVVDLHADTLLWNRDLLQQ